MDRVRYKLFFEKDMHGVPSRYDMDDKAVVSFPRQPHTLRKVDKWKLETLGKTAPYTYVEGVGFKVPYKYAKRGHIEYVFCIAMGEVKRIDKYNTTRELISLSRIRRSDVVALVDERKPFFNGPWGLEQAFFYYMGKHAPEVFKDRLKKSEVAKLDMVMLLPPAKYLEGFGAWRYVDKYDQQAQRMVQTEHKMYYLEV